MSLGNDVMVVFRLSAFLTRFPAQAALLPFSGVVRSVPVCFSVQVKARYIFFVILVYKVSGNKFWCFCSSSGLV